MQIPESLARVSPLNLSPEVVKRVGAELPSRIDLYDGTIRKILLTPGAGTTVVELVGVAEALVASGVSRMLLNVDWGGTREPNEHEAGIAREVLAQFPELDVTVYSDSIVPYPFYDMSTYPKHGPEIVDELASLGATTVAAPLFDPVDETARAEQVARLLDAFHHAAESGLQTVLGYADVGRADFDRMVSVIEAAIGAGAKRIDLYDSYCSLSVDGIRVFAERLRDRIGTIPLTLHTHDDFGMASAIAVSAATVGIAPDVAVNGASYRAGFAALEEVVLTLALHYGIDTGIKLESLVPLSERVEELSRIPRHPLKSVTGTNLFVRGGPSAIGYLADGSTALDAKSGCFAPSLVGGEWKVVWDSRTNAFVVAAKLRQLGLEPTDEVVQSIIAEMRHGLAQRTAYPFWLTDAEMNELCRGQVGV